MKEDFKNLIFKFKERLRVLNRSPATIETYCTHLTSFLNMISESIDDIKQVKRETIESYITLMLNYKDKKGNPYSLSTVSLKIRSIKRFFEFLELANIIFINPLEFIKEPKKENKLPKNILTKKEMSEILDRPNLGTLAGIRDRAILETFYSTGIRIGELCNLTIYDADLSDGMLRINKGKGSKDRVVPLGKHAVRFLREYITKVRPKFTKRNRRLRNLFVSKYSTPINKQIVYLMIRKYSKETGINKQVTAHTFRHTFATQLIMNGADITAVQKMMGHVSIRTTQGYIRRAGINLKKEHNRLHPREKDKELQEDIKPNIKRKVHAS